LRDRLGISLTTQKQAGRMPRPGSSGGRPLAASVVNLPIR
jgi:hypothetical protein